MQFDLIERADLDEGLQEELAHFELGRDTYLSFQQQYSTILVEDQKLREKAAGLEKQADATDKAWKQMAVQPAANQAAINEEIKRSEQLRQEAKALRQTADARIQLKDPLILPLAEQRRHIEGQPASINRQYWQALLSQALGEEGFRDSLLQVFVLCRDIYLSNLGSIEPLLAARCNGQVERQRMIEQGIRQAFTQELEALLADTEPHIRSPLLASMPPPVNQEIVAKSPVELNRLRLTYKTA
ncbi:hypothetical protein ACPA0O_10565 [Ectopseudomonas chengduensis]|jgi:hypothetical protein|nr:hypothetical protein [Pseudomonas sp. WS 5019]NMY17464.1 exonuclease SbcC [Pseudomonas sp. WS 5019]